ncbi:Cse1-domain-containing protein [Ascobolus immersus RN42]|uniref:Cse1-domain-containing protein n=1 Tax=Ascobolus immersus RN42 TaxID=1160509 RepID=A0A3N4IDL7_ASCIM|nr:Cse1-domain-containing protein [Ascobolus immersus RN42]
MSVDIPTVAQLLDASLNPAQAKQAEANLKAAESTPGFALLLLQIVASNDYELKIRLAGALFFKNFIRRNWVDEDGNHKLPANDVAAIKKEIVGLMISLPPSLQVQLGEAISIIADSDFWERWDTLVDDLVSKLTPDNIEVNNGVLTVAHSIFKRWRPLFRSDALFAEINHVLEKFCGPWFELLKSTDQLLEQNRNNKQALTPLLRQLSNCIKVFFDLSCQDLPPYFEQNLPQIMELFYKYLTYQNPLAETDDDEESGQLERVKAGICEVLGMYTQKYEDEFDPLISNFIRATWELLISTGLQPKYDILVSRALQFLTSTARIAKHAEMFNSQEVLSQVTEGIVLPNMTLRESDEELFEDDPIEFIRRDLEGSDSDTRRRAATDFLRQLLEKFEKTVTDVVSRYITHYLSEYEKDPKENWKSKDTALYLFTSIATKGTVTSVGVTSTNLLVDVVDFFQKRVASDLTAGFGDITPILKVDAIRYLYTFRSQMTKAQLVDAFPLLANHLASPNFVVYTYAAITIERILAMTADGQSLFKIPDVEPYSRDIVQHLFRLIEQGGTPEKIAENEYLMKCLMRILIVLKEASMPISDFVVDELLKITGEIMKNPSNPRFTHYHFESLGAIIRFVGPSQQDKLESRLFAPFMLILQNDVSEFIPYVFQLLALLLEAAPNAPLPDNFKTLVSPLLLPQLWESRGNVPALVRLIAAITTRAASDIVANKQLEPILGIFQKLVSAKPTEVHAFELLEAVFANFDVGTLSPYVKQIFLILLTRLQGSKTEAFLFRFLKLSFLLASGTLPNTGPDFLSGGIDQVQNGVFPQLLTSIILPRTDKIQLPNDRKTAVIGLTNLLVSDTVLVKYPQTFIPTLTTLLKMLELPQVPGGDDVTERLHEADIDDVSFGVSFASLITCRKAPKDVDSRILDLRRFVGEKLNEVNTATNGAVVNRIAAEASPEMQQIVQRYMA